jgi:hypothetical protein
MKVRDVFNQTLQEQQKQFGGFQIIQWPSEYQHHVEITIPASEVSGTFSEIEGDITFKPGMLRFDVMEKPHSVHIAPSFYLWEIT